MVSLLGGKAEVVFGVQLVTRHRAPRLAALLGLGIAALAAASEPSPERVARVVLLIAGRLAGALCVVAPVTAGMGLALATASSQGAPVLDPVAVALAYSACVAACTMAVGPG